MRVSEITKESVIEHRLSWVPGDCSAHCLFPLQHYSPPSSFLTISRFGSGTRHGTWGIREADPILSGDHLHLNPSLINLPNYTERKGLMREVSLSSGKRVRKNIPFWLPLVAIWNCQGEPILDVWMAKQRSRKKRGPWWRHQTTESTCSWGLHNLCMFFILELDLQLLAAQNMLMKWRPLTFRKHAEERDSHREHNGKVREA